MTGFTMLMEVKFSLSKKYSFVLCATDALQIAGERSTVLALPFLQGPVNTL